MTALYLCRLTVSSISRKRLISLPCEKRQILVKADGSFDLGKQKDLAQKFATIEGIKENIRNQVGALTNIVIV